MLEPTALYVSLAVELFERGVPVHALSHITGDGYMNLARVEAKVGFVLDAFPEWPAVFSVIAEKGGLRPAEMYTVFNMGIGLCVMVPEGHARAVIDAAKRHGFRRGVSATSRRSRGSCGSRSGTWWAPARRAAADPARGAAVGFGAPERVLSVARTRLLGPAGGSPTWRCTEGSGWGRRRCRA